MNSVNPLAATGFEWRQGSLIAKWWEKAGASHIAHHSLNADAQLTDCVAKYILPSRPAYSDGDGHQFDSQLVRTHMNGDVCKEFDLHSMALSNWLYCWNPFMR